MVLLIASFSQGKSSMGLATPQFFGLSDSWQEKRSTKAKIGKIRVMVLNEWVALQRIMNSNRYTFSFEIIDSPLKKAQEASSAKQNNNLG